MQAVLDCYDAFKNFKAPEGDDEINHVLALMDLSSTIAQKSQPSIAQGQDPNTGMLPAVAKMHEWSRAVQRQCCAKSLKMILTAPSPETPWNYKKMLAPEYQPFALALQKAAGLKDDVDALSAEVTDLEEVTKRLALFEAVSSALDASWMKGPEVDPLFQELKTSYESFLRLFLTTCSAALKDFQDTHFPVLQKFIDQYSQVASAAEKWQMNPVSQVFTDKQDVTKEDLEQLLAAKENVGVVMGSLQTFCGHVSSSAALNEVIAKAKGLYKTGSGFIMEANRIAGILLIGAVLWNGESKPEDAKATLEMAHTSFDTSKDSLPVKMQKLLADLLKGEGGGAAAEPEKAPEKTPGRKRRTGKGLPDEPKAKEAKRSKDGKDAKEKDSKKEKQDKDKNQKKEKAAPKRKAKKGEDASDVE